METTLNRPIPDTLQALRVALAQDAGLPTESLSAPELETRDVINHRISLVILRAKAALGLGDDQATTLESDVASHLLAASLLIRQTGVASEALRQAGIDHLVIKGAALGALQGGVSSRGAGDIDLLVEPADIATTCRLLADLGYYPAYRVPSFDKRLSWRILSHLDRETAFAGHQVGVDLHWRISPQRHLFARPTVLAQRARMVEVGGESIPTLSPGDALAAACFHAYYDRFSQLRALVDVHKLIPVAAAEGLPELSPKLGELVAGVLTLHAELFPGLLDEEIAQLRSTLPTPLARVHTLWQRHGGNPSALRPAKTPRNIWQGFLAEYALDSPAEGPFRFVAKRLFHFPPQTHPVGHQSLGRSFAAQLGRIVQGTAT